MFELLDLVKLPRDIALRHPRQLSGGQKQRVGVARAFAGNPDRGRGGRTAVGARCVGAGCCNRIVIDIQRREGTTLLFISHDLSVVRYLSDRIVVMYLGQIMEQGSTAEVFGPPYHPYTRRCWPRFPWPISVSSNARSCCRARSPRHRIRLPDAASARAAPTGSRAPASAGAPRAGVRANHRIACHLPREHLSAMRPFSRKQTHELDN